MLKRPLLPIDGRRVSTRDPMHIRFWARVDTHGPIPASNPDLGPCWLWMGHADKDGYGRVQEGLRPMRAHRVAWRLSHGEVASGCVLHRCDVRLCVRPSHLKEGTRPQNQAEMVERGRSAHGSRNGSAKLIDADVRRIRERHAMGWSRKHLAQAAGIKPATVRQIVLGLTWKHVS